MIFRNGTIIEADFSSDRIITPLTSDMTSMLELELPDMVSKTPIPSGKISTFSNQLFFFVHRLASNTLDPMNLTRSESRNTIGPSFKLQFDGAFDHLSTFEDENKKITDQVHKTQNSISKNSFLYLDFSCSLPTSSTIKTNLSYLCSIRC